MACHGSHGRWTTKMHPLFNLKPPQKPSFFSPSLRFEYREESSSSRPIYSSTEAGYHSPIQSRTLADAWAESVWNAKILGPKPLVFGSRPECQKIRKRGPIQHVWRLQRESRGREEWNMRYMYVNLSHFVAVSGPKPDFQHLLWCSKGMTIRIPLR